MISRFLPQPVRRLLGVKSAGRPPSYQLIDRQDQFEALLTALDTCKEFALDTEADNMYHYKVRVCLMQFLIEGEVFLLDMLADIDFSAMWPKLAQKHIIMHGSDFDLRLLHDLCKFRTKSIFDTMLAAQLLGRQRVGLAALLEDHFGVQLDKNGQKANWSKRPILPKLLDYAALDVWHLFELRDLLNKELTKLKRTEWMHQQCEAQIKAGSEGFGAPEENDWRIGKSEKLRGKGLSVLYYVWHWREEQAKHIDTPPFKVCSNDTLLKICTYAESHTTANEILEGLNLGKRHDRLITSLVEAVVEGLAKDPKSLPKRPGRDPSHSPLTQDEVNKMEKIKTERDAAAVKLGIEPTLIANRAIISQIARDPKKLNEILLPWQANLMRDLPSLASNG
jgi:ribonuclease D